MLPERPRATAMADYWNTDWLNGSGMFAPLRAVGGNLPQIGWPDPETLNTLADEAGRVVNAQGLRVRFVAQAAKSKEFKDGGDSTWVAYAGKGSWAEGGGMARKDCPAKRVLRRAVHAGYSLDTQRCP